MKIPETAILICGHGSREEEAVAEFCRLVEKLKQRRPDAHVTGAFLEFNPPSIRAELENIYQRGLRDIIVQPVMLYPADHSKHDIPEILARFQQSYPDARLRYGAALGLTSPVIDAAVHVVTPFLKSNCELLVVGRGSSDRRVTDQTITLCQKLHQRLPLGHARYCYVHDSRPTLTDALEQATHYPHVIILPFLLFGGRLLREIHTKTDSAAKKYPGVTFHKAPPLGPQDSIAGAILHQIDAL